MKRESFVLACTFSQKHSLSASYGHSWDCSLIVYDKAGLAHTLFSLNLTHYLTPSLDQLDLTEE